MQDNKLLVLEKIPFTPINQQKLEFALAGDVKGIELLSTLVELEKEGLIKAESGQKGLEYKRVWNPAMDEERKELAKSFNEKMKSALSLPRYEGYALNLEDNFLASDASYIIDSFKELDLEYARWHKNEKSGVIYPPRLASFTSPLALVANVIAGLDVESEQVTYGVEYETLAAEEGKPNVAKTLFAAIINYGDSLDFVQSNFLDAYTQPYFPNMGPFIRGERYLFNDVEILNQFKAFARSLNFVYFDGYEVFKTIVALVSDILAEPADYAGKNVNLLQISYQVENDQFPNLKEFDEKRFKEAREAEVMFNEFLSKLPLPEDIKLSYQFLKLEEVLENLKEEVKENITKRYLG